MKQTISTKIRTQLLIGKLTLAAIFVLAAIAQVSAQITGIEIREFSFTESRSPMKLSLTMPEHYLLTARVQMF